MRIRDCNIFAIRFARRFGNLSVVQNLATPQKTADASAMSEKHFSAPLVLSVLFLVALWFVLCRQLSGEWSVNQQYNFGWFVPFFAIYLFWLRWQDRPQLQIPNSEGEIRKRQRVAALLAIPALLLLQPARLFEIANPEWRLLDWVHATAVVTLTLLFIWSAGGGPWLRHFAFPVAFIFVAVPWPTVVEVPIIQGLMRIVARVTCDKSASSAGVRGCGQFFILLSNSISTMKRPCEILCFAKCESTTWNASSPACIKCKNTSHADGSKSGKSFAASSRQS